MEKINPQKQFQQSPSTGPLPHPPSARSNPNSIKKRKLPSPRDLVAHYEAQGLGSEEASLKVIDDLQNALFRVITSKNKGGGKERTATAATSPTAEVSRKLDFINSRLIALEMKVDSKPGYPEALAIGVASGAVFRGVGAVFPHIVASFANIWNSVGNLTKTNS